MCSGSLSVFEERVIDCPKLLKGEEDEWRAASAVSTRVEMALQVKTGLGPGQIGQKEMFPVTALAVSGQ